VRRVAGVSGARNTCAVVSLVMPVWQPNPAWFRQAVHAALEQQGCSIELIVVDDGNPEPIAELLDGIEDPRLVLVRADHGGVSGARNAGIARAGGEAFRFIDADDMLEPESTARLLRLSGSEGAIAYGSTAVCDSELRPYRVAEATVQGEALADCMLGRFTVYIESVLFPRRVVTAVGEFDPELNPKEDYDYILRALEHAPVRGERVIATHYRRHQTSASSLVGPEDDSGMRALEKLFDRRPDLRGTELQRAARAHVHVVAAERLMLAGRYRGFVRELVLAIRSGRRRAAPEAAAVAVRFPRAAVKRALRSARAWAARAAARARG
jgi:glycosyltransferase involved in cell wall biosynthesis